MQKASLELKLDAVREYISACQNAGVDFNSDHWIAKDQKTARIARRALLKCCNAPYGETKIKKLQQKPCCEDKLCCDPNHFTVLFKQVYKYLKMTQEEFNELMEEIDFERVEFLGARKYLEEFNEELPDSLKISLTTLITAIKIHENGG